MVESDEDDEDDDQKNGENKKVKKEGEERPRRILKTEPVDDDFVVNLDDDELSPSHIYNVSIGLNGCLPKL